MSVASNILKTVEEDFKKLAVLLPENYINKVIISLGKKPLHNKILSRILFEMFQSGYLCPKIVKGKEKIFPTEKLIRILAFTEAFGEGTNSMINYEDREKVCLFLIDFITLCSIYSKDGRLDESFFRKSQFVHIYESSLEKYHKKFNK